MWGTHHHQFLAVGLVCHRHLAPPCRIQATLTSAICRTWHGECWCPSEGGLIDQCPAFPSVSSVLVVSSARWCLAVHALQSISYGCILHQIVMLSAHTPKNAPTITCDRLPSAYTFQIKRDDVCQVDVSIHNSQFDSSMHVFESTIRWCLLMHMLQAQSHECLLALCETISYQKPAAVTPACALETYSLIVHVWGSCLAWGCRFSAFDVASWLLQCLHTFVHKYEVRPCLVPANLCKLNPQSLLSRVCQVIH